MIQSESVSRKDKGTTYVWTALGVVAPKRELTGTNDGEIGHKKK